MTVRLRRTWILSCIIYLVLLFDTAELQDITFPKGKDGKGKIDKGMKYVALCLIISNAMYRLNSKIYKNVIAN